VDAPAEGESTLLAERSHHAGEEAGTAPEDRRFRPDIQGLRAVAVTLVLLFHAHVPGMGGGYVGVDVFFVISGFVITGVLLRERSSKGSTSIATFYARRIRRILPAATLVIVAAVIASFPLLGPVDGAQTATDARWASVFLINVHFATTGTNYLASQLPPSLLQNYWSLAVEEQFYLIYPTIFLIVAGLSVRHSLRRRLGMVLGAAIVISFTASVIQTSSNATAAYFSPLPRVWELALGGLVATASVGLRRVPSSVAAALSWSGVGLILLAAVTFSSSTAYPGWAVAVPVVGAALVIASGVAQPKYGAEGVLRLRLFQWVGLISYSLYLWHWPILTLVTEHSGLAQLPVWSALGWELLAVGLAVATYRLLENPVRKSRYLIGRRRISLLLGVCLIAFSLAVATLELRWHDSAATVTTGIGNATTGQACQAPSQSELRGLMGKGAGPSDRVAARILLVGDSTACTMLPGLEAVAEPAGVRVEDGTVVGCGVVAGQLAPDVVNGRVVNASTKLCPSRVEQAEQRALSGGRPNVVVWSSSWEREALVVGSGAHRHIVQPGTRQWTALLTERMTPRVRAFTNMGATVVLLTQPAFYHSPSGVTTQDRYFDDLNTFLARFAAKVPHVKLVNLAAYECGAGPPCPPLVRGQWIRGDGAHYDVPGSLYVARWVMPQLGIEALKHPRNPLPAIRLTGVSNGQVLTGTTGAIAAIPSYTVGVTKIEFQASGATFDDKVIGTGTMVGNAAQFSWDTTTVPNGRYVVRAIAYDAAGHRSVSGSLTVQVTNPGA
jgi:peptidoglycan/LPS O-acetylase OafA/YrhL